MFMTMFASWPMQRKRRMNLMLVRLWREAGISATNTYSLLRDGKYVEFSPCWRFALMIPYKVFDPEKNYGKYTIH
jgi:hypothetical protein